LKNVITKLIPDDGNLVLSDANQEPIWSPRTDTKGGSYMYLQDDGKLSVWNDNAESVWDNGRSKPCYG
jgi:hypothetical protein